MLEAPWADDTDQNPTVRQTQHRPLKSSTPKAIPLSNHVHRDAMSPKLAANAEITANPYKINLTFQR